MIKLTPAMGWNTWNTFGREISDKIIRETADKLVETGLKDCGYDYLVIDDNWALPERDKNGRLVPDPERFPNGMKALSDYVHSKGLKFGMYSCAGYLTCVGRPASYEHEWVDAKTFAEWGVDFLKYDFCFSPKTTDPDLLYKRMGLALANCGRDILFSACSWGYDNTNIWIKETGAHMWRSTGDIFDAWGNLKEISQMTIEKLELNGQGCFNDLDMLIVGMHGKGHAAITGCTFEEYKLHFSLWALLGSPLFIGCDIRNMDEETKTILMNKDVIEIDQDPAYRQPFFANSFQFKPNENRGPKGPFYDPFYEKYPIDHPVIARYLDNGDIAIGFFNFTDTDSAWSSNTALFDCLGIPATSNKNLLLKDLWTKEEFLAENGIVIPDKWPNFLKAHSCKLYRAKIVDKN